MRTAAVAAVVAFIAAFTAPASAQECPDRRTGKWNILDVGSNAVVDRVLHDIKIGEYRRAANTLRPILRANPRNAETWQILGRIQLFRGNAPDAAEAMECAMKMGLSEPSVPLDYVVALFNGYRVRDAKRALKNFRKRFPSARTSELLAEFPHDYKVTLPL